MPTAQECVCCQEINKITLLVGDSIPAGITQHAEFSSVCLCRTVLAMAINIVMGLVVSQMMKNGKLRAQYVGNV